MRLCDPFQNLKLSAFCNYIGGGGGAPKVKPQEIPEPPPVVVPETPKPAPPPPPLPTESGIDAQNSADQAKKDAKKRRGMASSLLAGETGGTNSATGSGSLLG